MAFKNHATLFMLLAVVARKMKACNGNSEDVAVGSDENYPEEKRIGGNLSESISDGMTRRMKRSVAKKHKMTDTVKLEESFVIKEEEMEYASMGYSTKGNFFLDCAICKFHFKFRKDYERHFKSEHPKLNPYSCPHCEWGSKSRYVFFAHLGNEHGNESDFIRSRQLNQEFTCEICKAEFAVASVFERHALSMHKGVKLMKCLDCGKRYWKRKTLLTHQNDKHSSKLILRCELCKNFFSRSDVFQKHKLICAEKWEKEIITPPKMINMMGTEDSMQLRTTCRKCGEKFKNMIEVKDHVKRSHDEIKGNFSCDICQMSFVRADSFEKHHNKYHIEDNGKRPAVKYRRNQYYRCPVCGDVFFGVKKYEAHGKDAHPGKAIYKCEFCSLGFRYKFSLLSHARTKHGEANFSCVHCEKLFAMYGEKNRHEKQCGKKIMRQKEFYCDICQKTWRGAREWHMKNHDSYDYCVPCNQRFHREQNPKGLTSHIFLRHPSRSIDVNAFERAAYILQCEEEDNS